MNGKAVLSLCSTSAFGRMAEMKLAVALLDRGHKVAIPIVDDDGVDLVVDYRLRVQVKSTRRHELETRPGYVYPAFTWGKIRPEKVDVFALHADDDGADRWWFLPKEELGLVFKTTVILYVGSSRGLSSRLPRFENAWEVFGDEGLSDTCHARGEASVAAGGGCVESLF